VAKDGYEAYAVIDASGTWNPLVANVAVSRMVQGGVVPMTWLAVTAELQRDWRRPTGQALAKTMARLPFYEYAIGSVNARQRKASK
jgi:hypothetical protein